MIANCFHTKTKINASLSLFFSLFLYILHICLILNLTMCNISELSMNIVRNIILDDVIYLCNYNYYYILIVKKCTRPLSGWVNHWADNNRTGCNIRKHIVDLYIVTSVFIASGSRLRRFAARGVTGVDGHGDSVKGHDIYFRLRGGPQPISRKWHFRGPTFPESNNTESSFNKGSATIYRGHASHSHLSASTAYIAMPPPGPIVHSSPSATPFIPVRSCVRTHPRRSPSFSLSL